MLSEDRPLSHVPEGADPVSWYRAVYHGMDEVIRMLADMSTSDDMKGKPTATLAAGWVSGMALHEKERLRRLIEEADSSE